MANILDLLRQGFAGGSVTNDAGLQSLRADIGSGLPNFSGAFSGAPVQDNSMDLLRKAISANAAVPVYASDFAGAPVTNDTRMQDLRSEIFKAMQGPTAPQQAVLPPVMANQQFPSMASSVLSDILKMSQQGPMAGGALMPSDRPTLSQGGTNPFSALVQSMSGKPSAPVTPVTPQQQAPVTSPRTSTPQSMDQSTMINLGGKTYNLLKDFSQQYYRDDKGTIRPVPQVSQASTDGTTQPVVPKSWTEEEQKKAIIKAESDIANAGLGDNDADATRRAIADKFVSRGFDPDTVMIWANKGIGELGIKGFEAKQKKSEKDEEKKMAAARAALMALYDAQKGGKIPGRWTLNKDEEAKAYFDTLLNQAMTAFFPQSDLEKLAAKYK